MILLEINWPCFEKTTPQVIFSDESKLYTKETVKVLKSGASRTTEVVWRTVPVQFSCKRWANPTKFCVATLYSGNHFGFCLHSLFGLTQKKARRSTSVMSPVLVVGSTWRLDVRCPLRAEHLVVVSPAQAKSTPPIWPPWMTPPPLMTTILMLGVENGGVDTWRGWINMGGWIRIWLSLHSFFNHCHQVAWILSVLEGTSHPQSPWALFLLFNTRRRVHEEAQTSDNQTSVELWPCWCGHPTSIGHQPRWTSERWASNSSLAQTALCRRRQHTIKAR